MPREDATLAKKNRWIVVILSTAAETMVPSGIREIAQLAAESSRDVIRLETGEPSALTPRHIVEAAVEAARGRTGYTPSAGIGILREVLATRLTAATGNRIESEEVILGQGAVQLLASIMAATISPGDEVLVPDPGWPNYRMQVAIAGGVAVGYPLRPENDFMLDIDEIESLITPRTRVIISNSPSNPTGQVFGRERSERLVALAEARGLLIISDEVYDQIVFTGTHSYLASINPDVVASVFSFSKTYSMTGWRVGYALLPSRLARSVTTMQEAFISCLPSASQAAAVAAITGPQDSIAVNLEAYRGRRDFVIAKLRAGGIQSHVPSGAFYLMVPIAEGADSRTAAMDLVSHGVSMAPGTAFGRQARSFLRVSLASGTSELDEGLSLFLQWNAMTDGGRAFIRTQAQSN